MISAYILVQTDVGKESDVAAELASVPGVDAVDTTLGPYEVIAHATARTLDGFGSLILRRIQRVKGVSRTLTCPVFQTA